MEKMEMVRLIVQILHLLPFVRKIDYESGIEMKMENLVKSSVGERQKERKSKGTSSLDEIQHL